MNSEIIICPICRTEKVLNYGGKMADNDEVTSEEKCRCSKRPLLINGKKILDHALMIIKQKGLLNEGYQSSSSQVSKSTKTSK
jgi:hypothetical protein